MSAQNVVWFGFIASLIAGLATGAGALGAFVIKELSDRLSDALLGAAAGVMLAASFFSLLLPAIENGATIFAGKERAVVVVIFGLLLGAFALFVIHRYLPHRHYSVSRERPEGAAVGRIWLFVIAITLHNFPEGMAVGVGFAGGDVGNGVSLATGIGIQNLPEGLAVAFSLVAVGYSRSRAFLVAAVTGLVEPIGGLLGSTAVSFAVPLMPWAQGFAAGAMLFIISDEIIPQTHRRGFRTVPTFALLIGFAIMMYVDATLG